MRQWDHDGKQVTDNCGVTLKGAGTVSPQRYLIIWFHDECIFYAHDHHILRWVHSSETAKPYAKGEGQSLMVADFISADYGWLSSADGSKSAHVEIKPGKNRDGYFSNNDLLMQVQHAIDLVHKLYPNDDHVFVFDNARSHSKRAEDALSACHMPKGTKEWMVRTGRSCMAQMANRLRYTFPWVMRTLQMAPASHCISPQTTPHIRVCSRAWLSFSRNVATSVQNVLASSAQRILMANMVIAVAGAFYSMNLTS